MIMSVLAKYGEMKTIEVDTKQKEKWSEEINTLLAAGWEIITEGYLSRGAQRFIGVYSGTIQSGSAHGCDRGWPDHLGR